MLKLKKQIRNRYLIIMDYFIVVAAFTIMIFLAFPMSKFLDYWQNEFDVILTNGLVYCLCFSLFSIYKTDWIRAGHKNYFNLVHSCISAYAISLILCRFPICNKFTLKFNIIANFAACTLLCGFRFILRMIYKSSLVHKKGQGVNTLIIGAGRLSLVILRDIQENENLHYNVVGLIDDDANKKNMRIYGSKVLGSRKDIQRICYEYNIEEIIFAIYHIDGKDKAEILDICNNTGRKVKILSSVESALTGSNQLKNLRSINIEDLLERDPITLDNNLIEKDIKDNTVLVTGGGGSIGSELCRQILKYSPKRLVIVDIYENTTYEVENELREAYPEQKIDVLIASIREEKRLDEIFTEYKPDIIFHAAAHKHVPLMETSPAEAIKNNVFGTYNTAKCAIKHNVKRFVMISTDKAVNPTNIMGASKRMCEMIVQTMQKQGSTDFVAVRFGNVLGSHGSVVPRFTKQIEAGGPITVTHPEITRFFMTIPEAAQLVLQAAAYAEGGEIFVLDMGSPVKICDLAKKMIKLSGLKPDEDIKIEFTGLRPGEKLYEELLMNEEGLTKTRHAKIFVGQPIDISPAELDDKLNKLNQVLAQDNNTIKTVMSQVVPTYHPTSN